MWIKVVFRVLAGLVVGYLAYLPMIPIVEYATFGRVDEEKAFYAIFIPMTSPYLVLPSMWKDLPTDVIALQIIGALLLIAGVVVAVLHKGKGPAPPPVRFSG